MKRGQRLFAEFGLSIRIYSEATTAPYGFVSTFFLSNALLNGGSKVRSPIDTRQWRNIDHRPSHKMSLVVPSGFLLASGCTKAKRANPSSEFYTESDFFAD